MGCEAVYTSFFFVFVASLQVNLKRRLETFENAKLLPIFVAVTSRKINFKRRQINTDDEEVFKLRKKNLKIRKKKIIFCYGIFD